MTCNELLKILRRGEDSYHQFKENFSSIDQLAVEISAFANSDGGKPSEQFRLAADFVKRNLRKIQGGRNFNAPPLIEIPLEAFAEAIGNAIVHRDYFINIQLINDKDKQQFRVVFHRNVPPEIRQEENGKKQKESGK